MPDGRSAAAPNPCDMMANNRSDAGLPACKPSPQVQLHFWLDAICCFEGLGVPLLEGRSIG